MNDSAHKHVSNVPPLPSYVLFPLSKRDLKFAQYDSQSDLWRQQNVMLISYLLHIAAGGQQVAVGPPAVAPVLEEVGKRRSTKLKGEGGQKEAKPCLCNLPNNQDR